MGFEGFGRMWGFLRSGAQSPALVDGFGGGFELVLRGAVGGHDLDEGEEEGAVFFGGPLGCHGSLVCGDGVVGVCLGGVLEAGGVLWCFLFLL